MKYIKTPEQLNEDLSKDQLDDLEAYADRLFKKYGIDVVLKHHFRERVNDPRNRKPISYSELKDLFHKAFVKAGREISELPPETEMVLKDLQTRLNAPFKIADHIPDAEGRDTDMIMKTVMRKKEFLSSNPEIYL